MKRLISKIKVTAELELLTGLHIGENSDNVEIGGIDSPVIKSPLYRGQPYIPGSSLKGKMRCLLEQMNGSSKVGGCDKINNLFGYSLENKPSKLIVRDAYMLESSVKELENCDSLDMPYTESKWENTIDRVKGTAEHPRQIERVPAGVWFHVEFIVNVWDDDKEEDLVGLLDDGIKALEIDYLGGNGSRGYGQVKFSPRKIEPVFLKSKSN